MISPLVNRPMTDMATTYTLAVIDGEEKIVKNYGGVGPARLWAIEQSIDALLEQTIWSSEQAPAISANCTRGIQFTNETVVADYIDSGELQNLEYLYQAQRFGSVKDRHDWLWGPIQSDGEPKYHAYLIAYHGSYSGVIWDHEHLYNLFCSTAEDDADSDI